MQQRFCIPQAAETGRSVFPIWQLQRIFQSLSSWIQMLMRITIKMLLLLKLGRV